MPVGRTARRRFLQTGALLLLAGGLYAALTPETDCWPAVGHRPVHTAATGEQLGFCHALEALTLRGDRVWVALESFMASTHLEGRVGPEGRLVGPGLDPEGELTPHAFWLERTAAGPVALRGRGALCAPGPMPRVLGRDVEYRVSLSCTRSLAFRWSPMPAR